MQLKNKFEEILKQFRAYKNHHSTSREEDAENKRLGPSNKLLRRKYKSNTETDKDKSQDVPFQF